MGQDETTARDLRKELRAFLSELRRFLTTSPASDKPTFGRQAFTFSEKLLLPVALVIGGWFVQSALKRQDSELKMAELAVDILKVEPGSDSPVGLREWAVDVVDQYSGVTISKAGRDSLVTRKLVVASDLAFLSDVLGSSPYTVNIAFWNVSHLSAGDTMRLTTIANIVSMSGIDILVATEMAPDTALSLRQMFKDRGVSMQFVEGASGGQMKIVVFYNASTTEIVEPFEEIGNGNKSVSKPGAPLFARAPLYGRVKMSEKGGATELGLVAIHLNSTTEGNVRTPHTLARRKEQCEFLQAFVDQKASESGGQPAIVIGGVLNSTLTDESVLTLLQSETIQPVSQSEQPTWIRRSEAAAAVDHVFVTNDVKRLVFDSNVIKLDSWLTDFVEKVSDHRPVTVRLLYPEVVTGFSRATHESP
jgi:endonuclease/exonuclease/phosphatase family metal-dependent hydrolase